MAHCRNLVGQIFTRLKVMEKTNRRDSAGSVVWRCTCECGKGAFATSRALNSKMVQSCGCLNDEKRHHLRTVLNVKHDASMRFDGSIHPLYRLWANMKRRCYNKNDGRYYRYGALGIRVCDVWLKNYSVFRDYVLSLPNCPEGLQDREHKGRISRSLDRIRSNEDYKPGNLRWATDAQQQNNKSNNRIILVYGKRMTFADAVAKHAVVPYYLVHQRIYRDGWPMKAAFLTPKGQRQ